MSDDGEPHGTAGRPMLAALLHSGVGDIVAVSVRYYGGVKLGTGGLARAYSGGVTLALETLPTELKVDRILCRMVIDYDAFTAMERILEELDVTVEATDYGERVTFVGLVPAARMSDLKRAIADTTRGQGRVDHSVE